MSKDTKTLGNSKARACESLGFVHKKGCARVLTQPHTVYPLSLRPERAKYCFQLMPFQGATFYACRDFS